MGRHVQPSIRIQKEDFDLAREAERLTRERLDVGAVVTFTGLCRDEQGALAALELEYYPGMAEAEISRITTEAMARWPLTGLTVIHRHGMIRPGENIVLVAAAAEHRQAAFEAASFVMDFLKTEAPFWKKRRLADGTDGGWVEAKESDADLTGRWSMSA
ncbi:MAG TPA: molybdenum cofactor biosynthesis protein MoaE [Rhizobiaceae bacterium]|nr:molybdenum cofactor biosynthesis protein MoaE [Rhizobiaceae bacterium]